MLIAEPVKVPLTPVDVSEDELELEELDELDDVELDELEELDADEDGEAEGEADAEAEGDALLLSEADADGVVTEGEGSVLVAAMV